MLGQLSEVLGIPQSDLQSAYNSPRQSPLMPAVVALDVTQTSGSRCSNIGTTIPGVARRATDGAFVSGSGAVLDPDRSRRRCSATSARSTRTSQGVEEGIPSR